MSQTTELKTKFTKLLKEMFQLDQPELDFGLYKIMHSKAERINTFLDKELAEQIDMVFADADQADQNQIIKTAKQTLINQLGEGAFDENGELVEHFKTVPAAKDFLAAIMQAKSGKGNLSERAVIYDHLIRFFSRYYDGGDFMSRRYHVAENKSRAAAYAVPYDGSEVYLHWANKDQYYIKTTESFNLYSFDIAEAAKKHTELVSKPIQGNKPVQAGLLDFEDTPQLTSKRIHFKLVDADQGEHNNNKESEKRQFFIRAEQPVALNEAGELEIYFEFRVATKNDTITAEQEKQLKARFGAANKGDLPNLQITQVIQDTLLAMQEQPGLVDFVKFVQILAPTDKIKQRPLLTKYLNNYTSKNTMDYFIHKDLGGFLQRELDFYIKNEIMRLDDIEQADETHYAQLLKQIKTLRGVAKEIISFLAQLEDFQKKLWLKKKFVTETQYCITLDRLAEHPDLVETALNNGAQRQEWVKLFAIDLNELDQLKAQGVEAVLAKEKFKYIVLDTQFFDAAFKDELLAKIEDLDEQSNGLLINSDNFQAMKVVERKYQHSIDTLYTDPPYNKRKDNDFTYKDSYQHSSWVSMIVDRLLAANKLLTLDACLFLSIDENEFNNLYFAGNNYLGYGASKVLPAITNLKGNQDTEGFASCHEYIVSFAKRSLSDVGRLLIDEDSVLEDWQEDEYGLFKQADGLRATGANAPREKRPNLWYPIFFLPDGTDFYTTQDNKPLSPIDVAVWPINDEGVELSWYWKKDKVNSEKFNLIIKKSRSGQFTLYKKQRPGIGDVPTKKPKSFFYNPEYSSTHGGNLAHNLFNERMSSFTPKSVKLLSDVVHLGLSENEGVVLDIFAGSGTTGHAVINLNREDQGNRKYILVEMGTYFDTVTKPRIQKVIYAKDWKDGKPVFDKDGKAGGVSQCFKYLRLEQYEDTLNNLIDSRTYDPNAVPKDFILSYLLEAETAESPSLLNLQQFSQPRQYQLQIKHPNSDQSTPQVIDLVETFNWLIGLNVVKLDKWRAYDCEFAREHDPELPHAQHTRLKVTRMKQADAYANDAQVYQVRTVEGWVRRIPGNDELRDSVLVIWRNLSDDPEKDSAFLEAMLEKLKINQADSQFDKIYINGPHGLQLHGTAKTRLLSLEDTFMTKMWEEA